MNEEEKLTFYLEKLKILALEKLKEDQKSAIKALKESLHIIEGEMRGY